MIHALKASRRPCEIRDDNTCIRVGHADPRPRRKPGINAQHLGWGPHSHTSANGPNPMKIGTLLTAAIVSLSTVGGGLAVYVAVTKYQTMDKVSVAQSRLEVVRAVGDIPRYMNPERGFATNILFGPARGRSENDDRARQVPQGHRRRSDEDECGAQGASGFARRWRRRRQRDRCAECEVRGPARGHRQGDRGPGGSPQGRGQEDRRRQRGVQCRHHHPARRAGPKDGAARRRRLPAGDLCQHRLDAARCRRLQCQPAQEPRRRQAGRDRCRKNGSEPRPGPRRPDPDVAAGIARQSRDPGQCRRGTWQDERRLCRALRQGAEDRQGRRHQRQIRARCRYLLCGIATRPRRRHRRARGLLRQRRADPRLSRVLGAHELHDRARRPHRRDRGQRRHDPDGAPPRLQADRRPHRHHVAPCQRRRLRRDIGRRARRRDRRDGRRGPGLQGQHDQGGTSGCREGRRERRQDAAGPGARRTDARIRSQGQRTGRRAVGGIIGHGRHRALDVLDRCRHQPPGRRRGGGFRTDLDQRADGGERHRRADLLDHRRSAGRSPNPPRSPPAPSTMRAAPAIPPVRSPKAHRRSATS